MSRLFLIDALLLLCLTLLCHSGKASHADILFKAPTGAPVSSYTGALYWNTRRVVVEPPVQAVIEGSAYMQLICGFQLHLRRDTGGGVSAPPVEIRMRDPTKGTGQFYVKDGADLSAYASNSSTAADYFDFDISAFDCDSPMHQSSRVPVLLRVEEYEEPMFSQPAGYLARLPQSASIGAEAVRVAAREAHNSASVCRYEIDAGAAAGPLPFDVDGAGVIRVKSPLPVSATDQLYQFSVTASDCSVPESRKASVSVRIVAYPQPTGKAGGAAVTAAEKCTVKWTDIPEKLPYAASSGVSHFAERAQLSQCKLAHRSCSQTSAVVKVTVQSTAWGEKCDRSVHSLYDQRRVCQIKPGSVDLMNPYYKPPQPAASSDHVASEHRPPDCKCCKAAETARAAAADAAATAAAEEKPSPALHEQRTFDGLAHYVDVPKSVLGQLEDSSRLGEQFTLHFWLRHGPMSADSAKEQVVCSADEAGHNRHHYSVFLHNCKLILLLRQEYDPRESSGGGVLRPAEWRFKLAEVCDSEWHHYAVSYSGGRVKLDIDGKIFAHSDGNPQVLDDYPMHRTANVSTRLTIGACWHSADATYRQFFKGALAGIVLLRGELESDTSIHCLNQCHEKLDFRPNSHLEPGMSVSLNADYTMIEIKGHNAGEVARMLQKIGYVNVRQRLNPDAKTSIRLDTTVFCADPSVTVSVDPVTVDIQAVVSPSPAMAISDADSLCINGRNLIRFEPRDLASPGGVPLLAGLEIVATRQAAGKSSDERLDVCVLRTSPDFTAVESIIWPAGDAADVGIEGRVTEKELVMEGFAMPGVYQRLLSRVFYINRNPIIRYRTFVLTCSVAGGVLVSNEFTVKLSILHPTEQKHTVKKQLPDPPPLLRAAPRLLPTMAHTGPRMPAGQHHFAESHAAQPVGRTDQLSLMRQRDSQASSDTAALADNAAVAATPVAPIIVGIATAGILLVAIGLMYLRYRRSAKYSSSTAAAEQSGGRGGGGGGVGGKVLPVDAESQVEMEWDNSALNITVNPLDNEENMSDSGSEPQEDDYVGDELDLDGSSSCPEDDDDLDGMAASGLMMQRSAQIASSEDELDDDEVAQMVTGAEAVRIGMQQQQPQPPQQQPQPHQRQQLEWDDSSLPMKQQQHRGGQQRHLQHRQI